MNDIKAIRGEMIDCLDDPAVNAHAIRHIKDGLLIIENGHIKAVGDYETLKDHIHYPITHYPHHLIMPGLIDTHIHFPQTEMIAAYGEQLLGWLETYTFPTEKQFADSDYATEIAEFFLDQLLMNGTTTALVFGTVHKNSVDAFFNAALKKQLRMIAGKVLMDRNCPEYLQDDPETGYRDSKALINKWHEKDRLLYAVTPRFAPTSTPAQLTACKQLLDEHPNVYLHTHLSENLDECDWVKSLYPDARDYVDVYDQAGLLTDKTVLAHGIHLSTDEWKAIKSQDSAIAHCPSSNLFMGSGLFNLKTCESHGVKCGMGTDVGAGTSFSLLSTYADAYKVQQLQGNKLSAFKGLYLNTLGGAKALSLDKSIGNFDIGKEADFIAVDTKATELLALRTQKAKDIHDKLFALMMLAESNSVAATYSLGQCVYLRDDRPFKTQAPAMLATA